MHANISSGQKKKKIFFWNVLKTSGSAKLLRAIFGTFFLPLQAERSKEHKKTFFRSRERSFGVKKSFFFLCFFRCGRTQQKSTTNARAPMIAPAHQIDSNSTSSDFSI
jgi:hypothetical protein